jgi:uncharacterized protein YkwD
MELEAAINIDMMDSVKRSTRFLRPKRNSQLLVMLTLAASTLFASTDSAHRNPATIPPEAWQIVQLVNQARAEAGAGPLQWDAALAEAARQHCLRMAAEGSNSHQYSGEPNVEDRAGQAGAHFSLIAESVAVGSTPAEIPDGWMRSPVDHTNLLDPQVNHIGVAVIASRNVLYVVADYEHAVSALTQSQVEAAIARLLRHNGIAVLRDTTAARAACVTDRRLSHAEAGPQPGFLYRWQDSDLTHLPQPLMDRIRTPLYTQAAVGSCPAQDVKGGFTAYRVAVLLY